MQPLLLTSRLCICLMLSIGLFAEVHPHAMDFLDLWPRGKRSSPQNALLSIVYWTGNQSADWNDLDNWSPRLAPSGTADCVIPSSLSQYPVITSSAAASCGGALEIEQGATVLVGENARFSTGSAQVAGILRLRSSAEISIGSEMVILAGGLMEQQGDGGAKIQVRQAEGSISVAGTFSIDGPVQISGKDGPGDLLVQQGGLVRLNERASLGVTGSLRNSGVMQQTREVKTTDISRFLYVTTLPDGSGEMRYAGVDIETVGETTIGLTTVTVWGNQFCDSEYWNRNTVRRCFLITPSQPAISIVSFYYEPVESNFQNKPFPYRERETDWVVVGRTGPCSTGVATCVKVTDLQTYGRFTLHDRLAPPVHWSYFPMMLR